MDATAYIIPGQLVYMNIPAYELRSFIDGNFPYFAKCQIADSQAMGLGHRYKAGHDLFLDIPDTIAKHGVIDGYKHAGHIIFTDFPTKAGIPIPGFSHSGLGQWLESIGISAGWLNVNICDAGVGIIAIAEGSSDLFQAFHGLLSMDISTFFDTFVEGSVEVVFSVYLENPILLAGGIENILAGIISTWNTISVYVDPLSFFGASFSSAIIGFIVGHCIAQQSVSESLASALRGGLVGGLFSISAGFGFGAISGLLVMAAGRALARHHQQAVNKLLSVDRESIKLFIEEVTSGSRNFVKFLEESKTNILNVKVQTLSCDNSSVLPHNCKVLPTEVKTLNCDSIPVLPHNCKQLEY